MQEERDRILRMVADGTIRPVEAAQLLAALSDKPAAQRLPSKPESAAPPPVKPKGIEVDMLRPDGSHVRVEVPTNLIPMFWQIARVAIRESARTAASETWAGAKIVARRQVKSGALAVKEAFGRNQGGHPDQQALSGPSAETNSIEARRSIIRMVQNGRLTPADAERLIRQLDRPAPPA